MAEIISRCLLTHIGLSVVFGVVRRPRRASSPTTSGARTMSISRGLPCHWLAPAVLAAPSLLHTGVLRMPTCQAIAARIIFPFLTSPFQRECYSRFWRCLSSQFTRPSRQTPVISHSMQIAIVGYVMHTNRMINDVKLDFAFSVTSREFYRPLI